MLDDIQVIILLEEIIESHFTRGLSNFYLIAIKIYACIKSSSKQPRPPDILISRAICPNITKTKIIYATLYAHLLLVDP